MWKGELELREKNVARSLGVRDEIADATAVCRSVGFLSVKRGESARMRVPAEIRAVAKRPSPEIGDNRMVYASLRTGGGESKGVSQRSPRGAWKLNA